MIVIDSSALVELLLGGSPRSAAVAKRISAPRESLHAPHVIDLEVLSVLRKLEAKGLDPLVSSRAAADLLLAPVTRYPHHPYNHRIWQLRGNMTPYDACYIALAESLGAPLLTCDAKLAKSPGHSVVIEHVV